MNKKRVLFFGFAVLIVAACDSGDDDSSSGGGSDPGIGSVTISNLKLGFDNGVIVHSTVRGTSEALSDFTLEGGVLSGGKFDNSGKATISGGSVTIPVRGKKAGSSYEFTDGYTPLL
ncbi:MAG: hypothetical protein LBD74_08210 [Spirochaetaceae bacterium]|nr:hypothetical protein [Spirochaetaceae bacterium]